MALHHGTFPISGNSWRALNVELKLNDKIVEGEVLIRLGDLINA